MSRTLTVTCVSGLCNRLRVLLSGLTLAEASERKFAMYWVPHEPCGCRYADLFSTPWNVGSSVPYDHRREQNVEGMDYQEGIPDLLGSPEPDLYVRHYGWLYDAQRYPAHTALVQRSKQLIHELQPISMLAAEIQNFRRAFFRPAMIGVHARLGDHQRVNHTWQENISAAFYHVDSYLDMSPQAGIFLCTDDGAPEPYSGQPTPRVDIYARFVKRYGERVVRTSPASLDRRSKEAIQSALVDLWLLRACDYIVGTSGSTFSQFAVFGRPHVPFICPTYLSTKYIRLNGLLQQLRIQEQLRRIGRDAHGNSDPHAPLTARYLRRLITYVGTKI